MTHPAEPPVEYLRNCSDTSLRYFEMSKLEHVANLRRELGVLLEQMMEESALALLARWMLEKRSKLSTEDAARAAVQAAKTRLCRESDGLLGDLLASLGQGPSQGEPLAPNGKRKLLPGNGSGTPASRGRRGALASGEAAVVREHAPPSAESAPSARQPARKSLRPARPGAGSSNGGH
jgi:hypothetical protein